MKPQSHNRRLLQKLLAVERGATAVEYGMLVALIAAVIVATVLALGPIVQALYEEVQWW